MMLILKEIAAVPVLVQVARLVDGIGSLNGDCKGITITGENTVVNVSKGDYASCYIGSGIGTVTGNITIGDGATLNGVKYTETHTGTL